VIREKEDDDEDDRRTGGGFDILTTASRAELQRLLADANEERTIRMAIARKQLSVGACHYIAELLETLANAEEARTLAIREMTAMARALGEQIGALTVERDLARGEVRALTTARGLRAGDATARAQDERVMVLEIERDQLRDWAERAQGKAQDRIAALEAEVQRLQRTVRAGGASESCASTVTDNVDGAGRPAASARPCLPGMRPLTGWHAAWFEVYVSACVRMRAAEERRPGGTTRIAVDTDRYALLWRRAWRRRERALLALRGWPPSLGVRIWPPDQNADDLAKWRARWIRDGRELRAAEEDDCVR
jgi:hypothetical protein